MTKNNTPDEPMKKDFIRLLTDFGFKRIFGSKERAGILLRFLNALFEGELHIESLRFEDKELQPAHATGKTIRYDIYCTTSTGKHFVIEMQQEETPNFPERILFYICKAIVNQGMRGVNYKLEPVYCVILTNFSLSTMSKSLIKDIMLMERQTHEIYTDKERLIFLSLTEVPKKWDKCDTELKRLLYLIKNMEKLTKDSKPYKSGEYDDIFTASATGNLTNEEAIAYSQSYYRELENRSAIKFAEEKARAEGEAKKNLENARNFKLLGVDPLIISQATGLSIEEINNL